MSQEMLDSIAAGTLNLSELSISQGMQDSIAAGTGIQSR